MTREFNLNIEDEKLVINYRWERAYGRQESIICNK